MSNDEIGEGNEGFELVEDASGWGGAVVEEEYDEEVDQGRSFGRDDDRGLGVIVGGNKIVGGIYDSARGCWAAGVGARATPDKAGVVGLKGVFGNDC